MDTNAKGCKGCLTSLKKNNIMEAKVMSRINHIKIGGFRWLKEIGRIGLKWFLNTAINRRNL